MEFTISIHDNQKALALIEFLKTLDYVSLSQNKQESSDIPAWHLPILEKRIKDLEKKPNKLMDFDQSIDQIEAEL